ncbi:PHAF1 protein CG7083-like [Macrosteles quadrilineatus]|uniref:PHAF1 protein CG7083-like n=1 Tax=Macrosteles quadrilineatus TaxID=74068 RepID=UPI0023E0F7AB|nr:PHAF1 protein CG7083-like [Macrosteles quadrilineatus]
MLELEIVPERSIGCEQWEFILGMHFSQAVAIIQSQVGIIKGVQAIYSDSNPLGTDLVLNLPQDGIRLVFDSVVQRLKIIEIYNMKLVKLKYCGLVFNSPEVCPSIEQIEHSFGATHPGVYDAEKQLFVLNFRGLSFSFHVETKFQPSHTAGLGSLQFASGSSPCVSATSVYSGQSLADCSPPPLPLSCYYAQLYLSYVDVLRDNKRTRGLRLHLYTEGLNRRKQTLVREVHFSDTCQDVATLLGTPQRVFFKAEDKMKIHSPNAHRRVTARRSDFFFNYFSLGMDILFDARTQKVKKFVLHTNYPGHYNFNIYQRCEFHLGFPPQAAEDKKTIQISAYTKWDSVCESVKPSERPVVLNRASSTNTTNPFGSTFCYGFQDIIFEVMSNQHIASVTLYLAQEGSQV